MLTDFIYSPYFYYSNLIVFLFFAGLVYQFSSDLIHRQRNSSFLVEFLSTEKLLFGNWGAGVRLKLSSDLFLLAAGALSFTAYFLNSLIREAWPGPIRFLSLCFQHLFFFLLFIKIIFATKYSGWQLSFAFVSFFILRWTFFNSHYYWFMVGVLFVYAAKGCDLRRALRACLYTSGISMLAVALLAIFHLIPDGTILHFDGRLRYSFGYGWPNLTGAYLLGIAVMYVCYRGLKSLKWFDFCILAAAALFCNFGPDSRAATLCLAALVCALLVAKFFPVIFRLSFFRILFSLVPTIFVGISIAASAFFNDDNSIMRFLNGLFSGRIALGNIAFNTCPIKIAGQSLVPYESVVIDNVYLFLLFSFGPVVLVMFTAGLSCLLWKLLKGEHITEAICVLVFLLHGLMEHHIIWPCVNVTLWLMAGVVFFTKASQFPDFSDEHSSKAYCKTAIK